MSQFFCESVIPPIKFFLKTPKPMQRPERSFWVVRLERGREQKRDVGCPNKGLQGSGRSCLSRASDHKLNITACDHTGREMLREAQSCDFFAGLLSAFGLLIALCLSKKGTSVQQPQDLFYCKVPLPQGSLKDLHPSALYV